MLTAYRNQSPDLDPRQRVRQIVLDMVDGLLKRPDYMLVYIQEMQWLETWLPQHQATHLRNREQELWAFLQRWIGEAIEREQFATHDPFVTAMTMMGAIAWLPHWLSSTSNKIESKDAAEQIANLILNGLLPR